MKKTLALVIVVLTSIGVNFGQTYHAGFRSLQLKDSTRLYKPNSESTHPLHYRPVDLDLWYPSTEKHGTALKFRDLFALFEQRAVRYQDGQDYSGITDELAQFYVTELGLGGEGQKLLKIKTNSFSDLDPAPNEHPIILYMSGFNGMGFENFKVLEKLAQNGYIVIAIWSVGRYPGDISNQKSDMLEQVYDAEFAIRYLNQNDHINADFNNIGVIGCSWGGMSSVVFIERNPHIKAFVSLDGTETHYFGEENENDQFIQDIHDSKLFDPKTQQVKYLYLESGDKIDEFQPSKVYNYFQELNSEKYYLRFKNSAHADFTCIPAILEASYNSVQVYEQIEKSTIAFLNHTLRNDHNFPRIWEDLNVSDFTTGEPYEISKKRGNTSEILGMVLDRKGNRPLPYVNIGVLNKEVGTVSDEAGKFRLTLNDEFENDTIRISSIGYKPIEILVNTVKKKEQPVRIELSEEISALEEVVITAKAFRKKNLGNKTESKFLSTGFSYDQLGAEMGVKINVRKRPTFVDAFNFNISHNRLSAKSVFRINFYTVENNRPKENIMTKNILVPIEPKQTGKITVDLAPYDLVLSDDVIVSLEWVDTEGDNNKGEAIFFSLGMFNSGTLLKKSSQAKFKKYSSMGVGFNIDV